MKFFLKTILVPTDFSEGSESAVRYAFEFAQGVGAKVHLLHAYMLPVFPEDGGMMQRLMKEMQTAGERGLGEIAEKYRSTGALGSATVKIGDPRDLILQAAVDLKADLILMGTHGRRGFKRMFLGSVAEYVVRTATCGVLVVPLSSAAKDAQD